ncbi:MAG: glycosyltransferase family 2 protein [Bacteroidota bacterium]
MENSQKSQLVLSKDTHTSNGSETGKKALVTLVTPAYNEADILDENMAELCAYMEGLESKYDWEILIVNDGSKDGTRELADSFAKERENIQVHHHEVNKNLGGALQTGFRLAKGDIIIVMDMDLSYEPSHIERLLNRMEETKADVVIASPYMKGGKNTKVPFTRLLLSKVVNYFMRKVSNKGIHTFTSMVRAYRGDFLRNLNLKSNTYSINPEIIYKAFILRAKVEEIPAHLDWSAQVQEGVQRTSSIRIFKGILAGLMSGFIFRPYAFFMGIGLILMLVSVWVIGWIFFHTFSILPDVVVEAGMFNDRFSEAVRIVFQQRPHAFFVGGITLLVSLQFLGIGFLSLQNKRYFDELFHINSNQLKELNKP